MKLKAVTLLDVLIALPTGKWFNYQDIPLTWSRGTYTARMQEIELLKIKKDGRKLFFFITAENKQIEIDRAIGVPRCSLHDECFNKFMGA